MRLLYALMIISFSITYTSIPLSNHYIQPSQINFEEIEEEIESFLKRRREAKEEVLFLYRIDKETEECIKKVIHDNHLAYDVTFNQLLEHITHDQLQNIRKVLEAKIKVYKEEFLINLVMIFLPPLIILPTLLKVRHQGTLDHAVTAFFGTCICFIIYGEILSIIHDHTRLSLGEQLLKIIQDALEIKAIKNT